MGVPVGCRHQLWKEHPRRFIRYCGLVAFRDQLCSIHFYSQPEAWRAIESVRSTPDNETAAFQVSPTDAGERNTQALRDRV